MKLLVGCFFFYVVRAQVAFGRDYIGKPPQINVAFLRDNPTFLHKCDATFVSPDLLVTTAQCISCAHKCDYYVRAFSDTLTGSDGKSFRVKEVILHPNYDFNSYDYYDIGLIRLEQPVKGTVVFHVPDKIQPFSDFPAKIFKWNFVEKFTFFSLTPQNVRKISNQMCTNLINEYVPETEMCAYSNQTFSMGPYDRGSPLTTTFNNTDYILGIYKYEHLYDTYVAKYMSIAPFADWIRTHIQYKEVLRFSY